MPDPDSLWFTTRSALSRGGDPAWDEVARYGEPLRHLLARRYGWVALQDREDLVQDVLVEIKEKLAATHDPARGRFRALLQTVVRRRVVDLLRRARPGQLSDAAAAQLEAPSEEEVEALDLETCLLGAVAACRDRFTQGRDRDPDVLYALADRLIHGKTNAAIAAERGVSPDRIARLLRRGRDAIFARLVAGELGLADHDPALDEATEAFRRCLRTPREAAAHLRVVRDPTVRDAVASLHQRFRAALPLLRGDGSARGQELARGIALIFDEVEA